MSGVIAAHVIHAIGKEIEPNRTNMTAKELEIFKSTILGVAQSNERVLKASELRKVIASEPDLGRRAELQDELLKLIKG